MNITELNPAEIEVGVVGIGLMGSSIIASLLCSGHTVKAIAPIEADYKTARERIADLLTNCDQAGLLKYGLPHYLNRLEITMDYNRLANCKFVLECVIENINIKAQVYKRITDAVSDSAIIASNTSAIAITLLQNLVAVPERFMGVHYAEPAYATRFMEITCGEQTDRRYAEWVFNLAHHWGKEPTLLRKDIRGFITNRLMYAVYREIFHLIDNGQTTMEDADKAFRYDVGSWVTLMGLFRRMDYVGLADFVAMFKNIFPQLSNSDNVPATMQAMVTNNSRGIQNLDGLYIYNSKEAKEWDEAFAAFNTDIYNLAAQYPSPEREKIMV